MKQLLASLTLCLATLCALPSQAATTLTFDDLQNANYYRDLSGLYCVTAFQADLNVVDLVHGTPPPSLGIPLPEPMDAGVVVQSCTIGLYFQWDEMTVFGDSDYGTEYWIHGRDLDGRDIFVVHTIVQGVKIVTTPKSDAEIGQLWIVAAPALTNPSTVGRYGAVDTIKLRAKGEKLPTTSCTRRRGC
jgi:hypothetical protein